MATREIDENDYAEYERIKKALQAINAKPSAVRKLQEALVDAAPEMAGPEVRIRQEVNERTSGMEKKLDEFLESQKADREARQADEAKRDLEGRWFAGRKLAREAGYSDEGLEKLEAFMEREGVASHKVAMAAFERENPPPEPVSTGGSRWNFFDQAAGTDTGLDALLKGDDETFLANAIPAALRDVRGR